jgi:hypothetical protein
MYALSVSDEGESRDEQYLAAACEPISFCPWHNTLGRQGDEDESDSMESMGTCEVCNGRKCGFAFLHAVRLESERLEIL